MPRIAAARLTVARASRRQPIGVIDIEVDPPKFLYPHLQNWPTSSPTGETLLVRREGNEVVFLNELRHQKGEPLSLRRPIGERQLCAALAVSGRQGVVEGIDYRGVPVLAAVRAIPGTPWSIVAKVDQKEIQAPLLTEGRTAAGLAAVLIAVAALSLGFMGRRRDNRWLRTQLAVEREMRLILDSTDDGIVGLDWQGRSVFVNPAACRLLGYEAKELIGKHAHSLWHYQKVDGSLYPSEACPIYAAMESGKSCRAGLVAGDPDLDAIYAAMESGNRAVAIRNCTGERTARASRWSVLSRRAGKRTVQSLWFSFSATSLSDCGRGETARQRSAIPLDVRTGVDRHGPGRPEHRTVDSH